MADATYLQSSLYMFDADAINAVVSRLNTRVEDVSVKCWYDGVQHAFCLSCPPGAIGPFADGVLTEIISTYLEEELLQAERERRRPRVRRFLESDIDLLDVTLDELIVDDPKDPTVSPATIPPAPAPQQTHHFIKVNPNTQIKLFHLRDLPHLLERVLTPEDKASELIVSRGLTPRVVRWDLKKKDHVFNGRLGAPIQQEGFAVSSILDSVEFKPFKDQAEIQTTSTETRANSTGNEWRLKLVVPTVQQFLDGMGETEQLDPSEMPEMPADTKTLIARPTYGPASMAGRARVPKTNSKVGSSAPEHDSDEEDGESNGELVSFYNLIARNSTKKATCGGDDGNSCNDQPSIKPTTFASLLRTSNGKSGAVLTSNAITQSLLDENITNTPTQPITPPSQSVCNEDTAEPSEKTNTIPSYSRNYAAVDQIGLTTMATVQAEYEVGNRSPRKAKINKSGIGLRRLAETPPMPSLLPTEAHSTIMSVSTGAELQSFRSRGNWENSAPPRSVPQGTLVDVSAALSARAVKPPPGLEVSQDNSASQTRKSIDSIGHLSICNAPGDLIDLSDDGSDQIIERLADLTPDAAKRYTMGQMMPNKHTTHKKKNQANHPFPYVELEKPDSLPGSVPKLKAAPQCKEEQSTIVDPGASHDAHVQSSKGVLASFLDELESHGVLIADEMVVNFGVILLNHTKDGELLRGSIDYAKMQAKFDSEGEQISTEFLSRMTTSEVDFQYLLNLFPGPWTAECMHEIEIRTTNGASRIIRIDGDDLHAFKVFQVVQSAVSHLMYPMHTYDARVTLEEVVLDDSLHEACRPMVESLMAMGRKGTIRGTRSWHTFAIDNIYAKRVFRKISSCGTICLTVTELHKLELQAIDPRISQGLHNFQATAWPRQQAIEGGRLWFELGLVSRDFSDGGAEDLERVVDDIITKIDGVGFANVGPWTSVERPEYKPSGSNADWFRYSTW